MSVTLTTSIKQQNKSEQNKLKIDTKHVQKNIKFRKKHSK